MIIDVALELAASTREEAVMRDNPAEPSRRG